MEAYLRRWMKDALAKHQYDSAIYVGDKLLAITNSDSDAFNLAHVHFDAGNYTRALAFLARADLIHRSPAAKYLAAHCYVQQGRHEDALALLGDKNPTHLITTTDSARRKLQHLHATNGASKSHPSKAKGAAGRLDRADRSEERDLGRREDLKYEAGMCYLRGLCHAKQNAFDRAKECYKDAVRIDVQCFEAFDQLMKNSLMSPGEEWAFVASLDFESIQVPPPQSTSSDEERQPLNEGRPTATTTTTSSSSFSEAADFTRNLYLTRLSKYSRPEEFTTAIETLSTHYSLSSNPDILLSRAELLATTSQPSRALALTTLILSRDPYNFPTIPLHCSLLYQQNQTTTLFALAHDLASTHPHEPTTWLAVGTYYLLTSRIPEARSYFSKASLLDPQFGPAWIGFAHTFAAEGESDQAIAAYSTAARLFQGTHLPQMFLGMQELALENLVVAREYLTAAWGVCERDPVLVNELGVCWYKEGEFGKARRGFELGLRILEEDGDGGEFGDGVEDESGVVGVGGGAVSKATDTQTPTLRLNLAHALRKLGLFRESLEQFDEVIRLGSLSLSHSSATFSTNPSTSSSSSNTSNKDLCPLFTAKGLVLFELEEYFEATLAFHAALAISPQDPLA
ncbi:anaphase control protein cut9, partial [Hortaea werneckii]